MKHVSQNYKSGSIKLEEVDWPALKPGGVLVRTVCSVISSGTEGMKVREGKMSLIEKAKARPDHVKKVLQSAAQQGLKATYEKVMNKLDSLTPLGYSSSGVVEAVASDVRDLEVGQRVACAGAGYANHAEVNFVPRQLVVPVPEGVSMEHAAFTTIGSIAMQGFRQSGAVLGETVCVIGLGLLGQILVQFLKAAGVRVIGVDLSAERCDLARSFGAEVAILPSDTSLKMKVDELTGGAGVDCVILCAAGESNQPIELAVSLARDRARIVDVGKTKLDLPWTDCYMKELDFRFSRSYGPGRYDPSYEEKGVDYPIGYVRWTERRNMSSFLNLVADGSVNLDPIISGVYPFSEAEEVFGKLADRSSTALGMVFRYGDEPVVREARESVAATDIKPVDGKVRLGVIGAGNYASSMLLPHLSADKDTSLEWVCTTRSLTAANSKRRFGFDKAVTDHREVLNSSVAGVLIATRHASHAQLTSEALRAGKSVFVEKPLAITLEGLEQVRDTVAETGNDRLFVGFNRRFSPLVKKLKEAVAEADRPLVMSYRVHAGPGGGSWYADPDEGSRFVGEAGHFLDVFAYLSGARPLSVSATRLSPAESHNDDRENLVVSVRYDDGSVGNLLYLTQGAPAVPKEYLEVFGGGRTGILENFEKLTIYDGGKKTCLKRPLDKGQKNEMRTLVECIKSGGATPISVDCLIDTTLVTLAAERAVAEQRVLQISEFWR